MAMPAVAPSKFAWVTLDQYKTFLDPNTTDTKQDNLRQALVNAACLQIEKELKRPVVQRQYTEVFDGTQPLPGLGVITRVGIERIFLKAPVIVPKENPDSAITVTEAGTTMSSPQTLALGQDYFLYDDEGYIRRYAGSVPGRWAPGLQNITVTYTAGLCSQALDANGLFVGVTPSVTRREEYDISGLILAALELAKFHEKSGPLDYGKVMGGGTFLAPSDMPPMVKRLIAPWKTVYI